MLPYLERLLAGASVEYKPLGEVAEIGTGSSNRQDEVEYGAYPFYVRSKNILRSDTYQFDETAIIIPGEGGIGEIFHYVSGKYALHQRAYRIALHGDEIIPKYVYYYFTSQFRSYISSKMVGATATSIRKPMLEAFLIPIPPRHVQEEVVRILDKFSALTAELEAELEARRKQYAYYREYLLSFDKPNGGGKIVLNIYLLARSVSIHSQHPISSNPKNTRIATQPQYLQQARHLFWATLMRPMAYTRLH